jgi:biotin transport system substrate-specific component
MKDNQDRSFLQQVSSVSLTFKRNLATFIGTERIYNSGVLPMNFSSRPTIASSLILAEPAVFQQVIWTSVFAAATALGARLEIPHEPVPYTLQTMVVLLAGAFLGPRNGALSQLLYLGAGLLGAPVFAGGSSGLARLIGPTGGYLVAFPVAATVVGSLLSQKKTLLWSLGAMAAGLLLIFVSGTLHLYAFSLHDFGGAVTSGFLLFTWWDVLKLSAAAAFYAALAKRWPRVPHERRKN